MYSTRLTATLSGATPRQLAYWRRDTGHGPLLKPEYATSPRALYSFRDVVALRICVQLRKETSLQRVRRAVAHLKSVTPTTHLSAHNLKSSGRTIIWLTDDGDYIDTVEQPGQPGIRVVMEEVFRSFTTATGRRESGPQRASARSFRSTTTCAAGSRSLKALASPMTRSLGWPTTASPSLRSSTSTRARQAKVSTGRWSWRNLWTLMTPSRHEGPARRGRLEACRPPRRVSPAKPRGSLGAQSELVGEEGRSPTR